jgi:hypothetical protein
MLPSFFFFGKLFCLPFQCCPLKAPIRTKKIMLFKKLPVANVIKLFAMVIYHHSMVLLSSCVIKHQYCSKYHRMAVNNPDKKSKGGKHKYHSNLPQYFNPRIIRVKITMVIYSGIVF